MMTSKKRKERPSPNQSVNPTSKKGKANQRPIPRPSPNQSQMMTSKKRKERPANTSARPRSSPIQRPSVRRRLQI